MAQHDTEIHIDDTAARAGSTPHIVRYILIISLFLAIVALSAIWITGALNSSDDNGDMSNTSRAVSEMDRQSQ